jgi:hypothetical protein
MMGQVLKTVALAGSVALAAGASATGVLAQEDAAVMVGAAEPASTEEATTVPVLIAGAGGLSAEELTEAIVAEVLQRLALSASGDLASDAPAADAITGGGSRGGEIMVGGDMGGDVSLGGGAMPAPAAEAPAAAPAEAPAEAPAAAAPAAPTSGGTGSTAPGY